MKVKVLSRSGKEIVDGGVELSEQATVEDLKQEIYSRRRKFYPDRQRLTLPPQDTPAPAVVLQSGKRLSDYFSGQSEATVLLKDLGPQIGYKTVFFWEYFGPLAIYPIFYYLPRLFYKDVESLTVTYWSVKDGTRSTQLAHSEAQTLALAYWSFHYAKRIFETFFVHRFSHGTMPVFNLFRNCGYYWSFAAFVSFFVNHPLYTPVSANQMWAGFAIASVAQLTNLYCHIILRNLRPSGSTSGYSIPKGCLFNVVTCANYTTEIWGWIGFNIATQTVAGYLFLLAGFFQMTQWAIAKHKRLRKLFDGKDGRPKYPKRWIIFPPFL